MVTTLMPELIYRLSRKAQEILIDEIPEAKEYMPQCVIINFADKRNQMGGHLDDAEEN